MNQTNTTTGISGMPDQNTLQAMHAFADSIKEAKFLKPELRGDIPSIMYLLCIANDLGLPWTVALRLIYPVAKYSGDGQIHFTGVGIEGKAIAALLLSRGFKMKFEGDATSCKVWLTRPDGDVMVEEFTFRQAQAGGYTVDRKGNLKMPYNEANRANQLRWRVLGRCAAIHAADVLQGVYFKEELDDFETALENAGEMPTTEPLTLGRKAAALPEVSPNPDVTKNTVDPLAEAIISTISPTPTPVEPKPEPEPEPEVPEEEAVIARGSALKARIAKELRVGDKAASQIINEFLRGFLGVQRLPNDWKQLPPALDAFDLALANPQLLAALTPTTAREVGKAAGPYKDMPLAPPTDLLLMFFERVKWAEPTRLAARSLIQKWHTESGGFSAENFIQYAATVGLDKMTSDDALAYISVALLTREAYMLSAISSAVGLSMQAVVSALAQRMGKKITADLDGETLVAAITEYHKESVSEQPELFV